MRKKAYFLFCFVCKIAFAQKDTTQQKGYFSGSLQFETQHYAKNTPFIENPSGINSYLQLNYQYKNLRIGVRGEGYFPPMIGYPSNLNGFGLANRFVNFHKKKWDAIAGNFYEQIGNGLIFRATEQRFLGMDTSLDGFVVKRNGQRFSSKAFAGKQRIAFKKSYGTLFGLDNEVIISKLKSNHLFKLGLGAINKLEPYDGILETIHPNVWATSSRATYQFKSFQLNAEYAHKSSDASANNAYVTRFGRAFYLTSSFDKNQVSVTLHAKRTENMDFRSQRGETLNSALINYIPNTAKQQPYRLLTLYPYASQAVLGEVGEQLDISYLFEDGGALVVSSSAMNSLKKYYEDAQNYHSRFFEIGDEIYFRNLSGEYEKKWSKKVATTFLADYTRFNKGVILGGKSELVNAFTVVADASFRLKPKQSLRVEVQHLSTKQDLGNWAMLLAEYSIAPHYFFYVSDEINYHKFPVEKTVHYYAVGTAISKNSNRLALSYGKVRQGLLCVGGICRIVPTYEGLTFSLMSSF